MMDDDLQFWADLDEQRHRVHPSKFYLNSPLSQIINLPQGAFQSLQHIIPNVLTPLNWLGKSALKGKK